MSVLYAADKDLRAEMSCIQLLNNLLRIAHKLFAYACDSLSEHSLCRIGTYMVLSAWSIALCTNSLVPLYALHLVCGCVDGHHVTGCMYNTNDQCAFEKA